VAQVDGIDVRGTTVYVSFSTASLTLPGGDGPALDVQDEDVVALGERGWSTYLDGTAAGLGSSPGLDVDAFDLS
jgi:hypothetical protein